MRIWRDPWLLVGSPGIRETYLLMTKIQSLSKLINTQTYTHGFCRNCSELSAWRTPRSIFQYAKEWMIGLRGTMIVRARSLARDEIKLLVLPRRRGCVADTMLSFVLPHHSWIRQIS
jgi:hypothetical protein